MDSAFANLPTCCNLPGSLETVLEVLSWSFTDTCPCDIFSAMRLWFLLVILLSKWSPSVVQKCCQAFQVQEGCDVPGGENVCVQ